MSPRALRSAYFDVLGDEPAWTNYTPQFKGTLDYIFYDPKAFAPLAVLQLPAEGVVNHSIYSATVPNDHHPSDHFPIMTIFDVKKL